MVESVQREMMTEMNENLTKLTENENQSSFALLVQMALLESCLKESKLMMRSSVVYEIIRMEYQNTVQKWTNYTTELLSFVESYTVEPRYCGILTPVRRLPSLVDRLVEARAACAVCSARLLRVLHRDGPVKNQLRSLHTTINEACPKEAMAKDGGLEILIQTVQKIEEKIDEIAEHGPKYKDLIRMENYYFLGKSLLSRRVNSLAGVQKECEEKYEKVEIGARIDRRRVTRTA